MFIPIYLSNMHKPISNDKTMNTCKLSYTCELHNKYAINCLPLPNIFPIEIKQYSDSYRPKLQLIIFLDRNVRLVDYIDIFYIPV